ncbi:MAG: hypothetical protein ACJ8F7_14700 [Gemmataceae bacterium]
MTTKLETVLAPDNGQQHERQISETIGRHVLQLLGRPDDLQQVQVRRLWQDHYRVNVVTGNAGDANVVNSFFLVADSAGAILRSTPSITKRY